jgi:hypothetical protein
MSHTSASRSGNSLDGVDVGSVVIGTATADKLLSRIVRRAPLRPALVFARPACKDPACAGVARLHILRPPARPAPAQARA